MPGRAPIRHHARVSRPPAAEPPPVGLITGTGLYSLGGLEDARTEVVATRHGPASVTSGRLAGQRVLHVPRHGAGHARLSHQTTPRATISALAQLGAGCVVATTVCGACDPALELGSLVVFDDLHFPSNRMSDGSLCTLFTAPGEPGRGHWIFERPFAEAVRRALLAAAAAESLPARDGGVYGHVDGPRFNTVAEIRALRAAGVDAVSQTAGPEVVLAGEAGLPLALVGYVTDHANGVSDPPTPPEVLERLFRRSGPVFERVLSAALPALAQGAWAPSGIVFQIAE
jgi:purine nucleoside phosphorylase